MFSYLKKLYTLLRQADRPSGRDRELPREELSTRIGENIKSIRKMTGESSDIIIREFSFGRRRGTDAALVFVDGMSNPALISSSVINPLMHKFASLDDGAEGDEISLELLERYVLSANDVVRSDNLTDTVEGFLSGDAALLINGEAQALVIGCKNWEKRSISEPSGESVIRGPKESFVESMRTNVTLIRRKINNPALAVESMTLGHRTRTKLSLVYLGGIAKPELISDVKRRLRAINTDSILESGYIEQYIEGSPFSLFATVGNTEKPDVAAAKILEGRAAIIVDGTPIALTVPYLFIESLQTAEDYYSRPFFSSMLRIVRFLGLIITIYGPAFYVAVTTFHQELIPTALLFTMASAREGIPFPAFIESLIMIFSFEILREAGLRLPRPVGQAMSIVGALVMGEAAVSAGLVGAPMVIVVAITAVSCFIVPSQIDSAAILRIIMLILSGAFGGYGIVIGTLCLVVHMASLQSFGAPYLFPAVPMDPDSAKDNLLRFPLWLMKDRPRGMARDPQRKEVQKPPAGNAAGEG